MNKINRHYIIKGKENNVNMVYIKEKNKEHYEFICNNDCHEFNLHGFTKEWYHSEEYHIKEDIENEDLYYGHILLYKSHMKNDGR